LAARGRVEAAERAEDEGQVKHQGSKLPTITIPRELKRNTERLALISDSAMEIVGLRVLFGTIKA
jgi:hypothetical protein